MMSSGPKRVAYFAENALSPIQGGGIVAYAVLKGLPPEKLLGFYDYENITPVDEYAECFVLLNRWKLLNSLCNMKERILDLAYKISPFLATAVAGYFLICKCLPLAVFFPYLSRRDFAIVLGEMKRRQFFPELVYFSGLSRRYLTLAVAVARHFDVPMAVLHMDDWMAREKKLLGKGVGAMWHHRTIAKMREAAARSLSNTTNSPGLAMVITTMTGHTHEAANNCCADLLCAGNTMEFPDNPVPVITYAGAMNKNLQGEALIIFSRAIAELNAEGLKVQLRIYSPWEFAPIANSIQIPGAVEYCGQASREELAKAYLLSDFLVTSTTFEDEKLVLFRHSLSTKLSEYLCVGRPVISVGNSAWHLHEYVHEHGCGFTITDKKLPQIKARLRHILSLSKEELEAIGRANRELWKSSHDVEVMSRKTRQAIGMEDVSFS